MNGRDMVSVSYTHLETGNLIQITMFFAEKSGHRTLLRRAFSHSCNCIVMYCIPDFDKVYMRRKNYFDFFRGAVFVNWMRIPRMASTKMCIRDRCRAFRRRSHGKYGRGHPGGSYRRGFCFPRPASPDWAPGPNIRRWPVGSWFHGRNGSAHAFYSRPRRRKTAA